jgi:RNA polymerase sigma-70 factor (ECF subfamily)
MQQDEFTEKIVPLSNKLLRFASFFLGNEEDGRDVVQEVLLKLWQNRIKLDGVSNAEAYAMQMVRNRCLDQLKSSRMTKFRSYPEVLQVVHDDADPTEWKDTNRLVMQVAGKLPEVQKSILFLRDMEQLEYEEISAVTGLNVNAVRVNLSRARKQVREELLKIWEHEIRRSKSYTSEIL